MTKVIRSMELSDGQVRRPCASQFNSLEKIPNSTRYGGRAAMVDKRRCFKVVGMFFRLSVVTDVVDQKVYDRLS